MKIQVQLVNGEASLPVYSTAGAAGCDIFASEDFTINPTEVKAEVKPLTKQGLKVTLESSITAILNGEANNEGKISEIATTLAKAFTDTIERTDYRFKLGQATASTGVAFGIPLGSNIELEIRSKSGLAFKKVVHAFNGTLDEDYTNELKILMFNLTAETIHFKKGEKIAQAVFKQVIQANFELVDEFDREVIPNPERDGNPFVIKNERTGGFGSTGTTLEGTTKL